MVVSTRLEAFYTDPTIHKSVLHDRLPGTYLFIDNLNPIVTAENNFDKILIPKTHVSRKRSDTFYLTEDLLLRTHTSAHQHELLKNGVHNFCVVGDVYRKDEIDATHYPVFHQMEAVRLYKVEDLKKVAAEWLSSGKLAGIQGMPFERQNQEYQYFSEIVEGNDLLVRLVVDDLKETHQNLMKFILKDETIQYRWNPDYFPFTEPSFEMEIYLKNRWLEVLGSGIVHKEVLQNAGVDPNKYLGWASGIGLERIAMILFDIPDIRLFWSQDERFLKQFTKDKVSKFKPFSKYPSCFKDIAFYVAKK